MNTQHIAAAQERPQVGNIPRASGICSVRNRFAVVVYQIHPERLGADGEGRANATHAEDPEDLVVGIVSKGEITTPVSSTKRGLSAVCLAESHEEKRYRNIRSRVVDGAGGMGYENTYLARPALFRKETK